jgi:anti-sigma factor ChrR (cupin superfamily)
MTDQAIDGSSNPQNYCFCELAPLFSLNLLTAEERQWVEQQVVDCPELAAELEQYQLGVTAIPYGLEPAQLAGDVKQRLFNTLGLETREAPATVQDQKSPDSFSPFMSVRSAELQWGPHPHRCPKVQVAFLHTDPVTRECVGLLRAEPGLEYPAHHHAGVEEIYMLSGDLELEGITYYAGDYIRSAAGSTHSLAHSIEGCMFFFRSSMDDEYPDFGMAEAEPLPVG